MVRHGEWSDGHRTIGFFKRQIIYTSVGCELPVCLFIYLSPTIEVLIYFVSSSHFLLFPEFQLNPIQFGSNSEICVEMMPERAVIFPQVVFSVTFVSRGHTLILAVSLVWTWFQRENRIYK